MDADKLRKLKEIDYRMLLVCALCRHSCFHHNDWGTCSKHSYRHQKHTDSKRDLSVSKFGTCPDFEVDSVKMATLEGWFRELAGGD